MTVVLSNVAIGPERERINSIVIMVREMKSRIIFAFKDLKKLILIIIVTQIMNSNTLLYEWN